MQPLVKRVQVIDDKDAINKQFAGSGKKEIGRKLTAGKSNENAFGKKGLEHPYYYIKISSDLEL